MLRSSLSCTAWAPEADLVRRPMPADTPEFSVGSVGRSIPPNRGSVLGGGRMGCWLKSPRQTSGPPCRHPRRRLRSGSQAFRHAAACPRGRAAPWQSPSRPRAASTAPPEPQAPQAKAFFAGGAVGSAGVTGQCARRGLAGRTRPKTATSRGPSITNRVNRPLNSTNTCPRGDTLNTHTASRLTYGTNQCVPRRAAEASSPRSNDS
jgi:hypothetical protein